MVNGMAKPMSALPGWWTISSMDLLDMLWRAHHGENPDFLYVEEYANADHEYFYRTGDED